MPTEKFQYTFLDDGVTFRATGAGRLAKLYFPLCSPFSDGLKSSVSPHLSGDIKVDRYRFLTPPASREDLHRPVRDFWIDIHGKKILSLALGESRSTLDVEGGMLWHQIRRTFPSVGLVVEALNFIPVNHGLVELMRIRVRNVSQKTIRFTATAVCPIFGRALANKHDHEHVTSLLHRIEQWPQGVVVQPTMIFDEEGHRDTATVYYVFGRDGNGRAPSGTFPTRESFFGESFQGAIPRGADQRNNPENLPVHKRHGQEAFGGVRFKDASLRPNQQMEYILCFGVAHQLAKAKQTFTSVHSSKAFEQALRKNIDLWTQKSHTIDFSTGNPRFDSWMHWVTIQPVLRRVFGCSFLPDHDYGKGGRGWRDIWQDKLTLLLIEAEHTRRSLVKNFAGVRIDGSNATIIGEKEGEFLADRNAITRVWMDHGAWPFNTLLLYIHQTGDWEILFEKVSYFRDPQIYRTYGKDITWSPEQGNTLKDRRGKIYYGTILEHILIEHLVQFFNVGEHNITRLENADWNDGLDMAFDRGESVPFMCFYGGNMLALADLLEQLSQNHGVDRVELAWELRWLVDSLNDPVNYNQFREKKKRLFEKYCPAVQPCLSGKVWKVRVPDLVKDLRKKGEWIARKVQTGEKIRVKSGKKTREWFNGYYDNEGHQVEGRHGNTVRMTLTGQVFPILSGVARPDDIEKVITAVHEFLRDKKSGGYRLNSDFGLKNYLSLGRAFGFAYGTKENGAVFCHMAVMYAYGLYFRGFVHEGYRVIKSLFDLSENSPVSRIYPGIPEYFDAQNRGMYPYLTGSASWLVLTLLTQAFGVRGEMGDLVIQPKLVKEQFAYDGKAEVACHFAGKDLTVAFHNPARLDYGSYGIAQVRFGKDEEYFDRVRPVKIAIKRAQIQKLAKRCRIDVTLAKV